MIAPPIRVVPPNKVGGNARHELLGIRISEAAPMKTAVLAQEVVEWQLLRKVQLLWLGLGALVGGVPALFLGWPALAGAVAVGWFIGGMEAREKGTHRRMEFLGHAVEIAAAVRLYGADEARMLREEAQGMATWAGYQDFFKGWTAGRIEAEMVRVMPAARAWVARNSAALESWKERIG